MKTRESTRKVDTGGLLEIGSFEILATGKAFKVLIDGLYANKIKAAIRELCSNAFDSHVAASRKDRPFLVQLPTILDPTFRVRDYGTSLSHADVMGLYKTVFKSSKENTNAQVGKLGLGSKSPFAYTDSFTVTAYLDGEARVYGAFIGDDGVPSIALMSTGATTEENGLDVSFPIQARDVQAFKDNAYQVIRHFDVKPILTGQVLTFPDDKPIVAGKGWKILPIIAASGCSALARQGVVAYPLDPAAIPNLSEVEQQLLKCPIHIDFPIGSLEIAASREALSYDKPTVANIQRRLKQIEQEIVEKYSAEIKAQPTFWQACIVYQKMMVTSTIPGVIRQAVKANVKFDGRDVSQTSVLGSVIDKLGPIVKEGFGLHYLDGYASHRKRLEFSTRTLAEFRRHMTIPPANDTLFYVTIGDKPRQEAARIRQEHHKRGGHALILIRAADQDDADKVIAEFGNPPYVLTSTLPEISQKARTAGSSGQRRTTKDQIKAKAIDLVQQKADATQELVDLDRGGYYAVVSDGQFEYNARSVTSATINSLIHSLIEAKTLDYITATDRVYLVSGPYIARVKNRAGWTEIGQYIDEKLKADSKRFEDAYERSQACSMFGHGHVAALVKKKMGFGSGDAPLSRLKAIYDTCSASEKEDKALFNKLYRMSFFKEADSLNRRLLSDISPTEVDKLMSEVDTRYPLLRYINSYDRSTAAAHIAEYVEMVDQRHSQKQNLQRAA